MNLVRLLPLVIALSGCRVSAPSVPFVQVVMDQKVKAQVKADVEVDVRADAVVDIEGAQVVEFFGVPLEGAQDVVFVLDCSGSMNSQATGSIAQSAQPQTPGVAPHKIDVARRELIDALQRLPAGTRVNVLFFNVRIDALAAGIEPLEEADRQQAITFVEQTAATGGTALAPAMRAAFLMNPRRVVLLSDGLGNVGGDGESVLRDAREAMTGGVRIDTIGLGNRQDRWLLSALATESGGLYQPL